MVRDNLTIDGFEIRGERTLREWIERWGPPAAELITDNVLRTNGFDNVVRVDDPYLSEWREARLKRKENRG